MNVAARFCLIVVAFFAAPALLVSVVLGAALALWLARFVFDGRL
ncbi:MAG TPA: hypothetical protein VG943_13910 [Caulobacterales bacterium]|nr:hypothetical protein [Caulobacterales bacterium]